MSCPFLHETRVRYCHAVAVKKMIATGQGDPAAELCSTPRFVSCRLYQERGNGEGDTGGCCSYLHDSLVHYCGAAPIMKFIPFSDHAGRCGSEGYRFCELYLGLQRAGDNVSAPKAAQIRVPADLLYAPNHMWLYTGPNGACHIGIDEFFASILGGVDHISFVTTSGVHRPNAVVTVRGVDWPISFRNRLLITAAHVYLRSNPARLTSDPYGSGWVFEGWELPDTNIRTGLMSGPQALAWMQQERARLDEMIHQLAGKAHGGGPAVLNDGGQAVRDVLGQLGREEILRMLHAFFAPDRAWGEELRQ